MRSHLLMHTDISIIRKCVLLTFTLFLLQPIEQCRSDLEIKIKLYTCSEVHW